jgi:monofunctional biosynthetic peptidoglycan transglycosylase
MIPVLLASALAAPVPQLGWYAVNDTVMGGVSQGRTQPLDDGQVRFTGELSLESNGGFVSIRSQPSADLDLDQATALRVRLRGDGRAWKVLAYREDIQMRAGGYRTPIQTTDGEVVEVTLPLASFMPSSFGRPVPGAPALDAHPERIVQIGFLLADKNPGPFALDVLSVEVVDGRRARGTGGDAIRRRLDKAVSKGVPAYNRGDPGTCRDLYREALEGIVASEVLTDGERRIVSEALEQSASLPPDQGAWALRHAIDTVMSSDLSPG